VDTGDPKMVAGHQGQPVWDEGYTGSCSITVDDDEDSSQPKFFTGNHLLLLLHLGCTTNQRSNSTVISLSSVGSGSPGSSSVISGVFIAEEVDAEGDNGQEIPQQLMYKLSWRPCELA